MALPVPCLMLVTDRHMCGGLDGLLNAVHEAVEGGIHAVQMREKDMPFEDQRSLGLLIEGITRDRVAFVVNGELELAMEVGAEGIHLPEAVAPVQRPREGFLIGRSVHSLEAARRAADEAVDYIVAGPVYETRSHMNGAPMGPVLIEEISPGVSVPVLAIGGVTAQRVPDLVRAGASGVAVISAILGARDVRTAVRELRGALDQAWAANARPA